MKGSAVRIRASASAHLQRRIERLSPSQLDRFGTHGSEDEPFVFRSQPLEIDLTTKNGIRIAREPNDLPRDVRPGPLGERLESLRIEPGFRVGAGEVAGRSGREATFESTEEPFA
jgi:hypothetical protein